VCSPGSFLTHGLLTEQTGVCRGLLRPFFFLFAEPTRFRLPLCSLPHEIFQKVEKESRFAFFRSPKRKRTMRDHVGNVV
jgi:hypothetical protein